MTMRVVHAIVAVVFVIAILVQVFDAWEEVPDLVNPKQMTKVRVKTEEFRCQEQSCEHEFEKVIRELST